MTVTTVPIYPEGVRLHLEARCTPDPCPFHNPSVHHMVAWPMNVRTYPFRRAVLVERQCAHGIGHPDPDSLAYVESFLLARERGYFGVHGCDGCCRPPHMSVETMTEVLRGPVDEIQF